eukprot:CAMPEP_0170177256 /NCGR_PEP_ID=MMETSP0040_2-20121228/9945_1 /TAXON_ID=641309 /ORGANISM="Lotharella oceanica, Strain CCMP622" /LENGTH=170 /DNA_ID=CAMNT_0010419839 /DNA_START=289 /DNA_END=800 /DNA_ORIENTATION=+
MAIGVAPVVTRLGQRRSPDADVVRVDVEGHVAALVDSEEPAMHVDEALGTLGGTLVAGCGVASWARDESAELVIDFAPRIEPSEIELRRFTLWARGDLLAVEGHEAVVGVDGHGTQRQILVPGHFEGEVGRGARRYGSRHAECLRHPVLPLEQVDEGLRVAVLREDGELW